MGRRRPIKGLVTALLTPFDGNERVEEESLAELLRFQISKGTQNIFACGTTGLGPLLSVEERKRVAEVSIEGAGMHIPIVVQVGAADTATSVALAKHAEKRGADAIASLTPYYYKPGDEAIMKHFERIARAVSVPLFAYNIPQFTGNNLSQSIVGSMAKKGTIVGIKDSSRDFLQLLGIIGAVPESFTVMNGTEEYALFAMMSGADGIISGAANAFPELFRSLVDAHGSGNYPRAEKIQRKIVEVKEAIGPRAIAGYYEILRGRGINCGGPRGPMTPLNKEEMIRIRSDLSRLDVPLKP